LLQQKVKADKWKMYLLFALVGLSLLVIVSMIFYFKSKSRKEQLVYQQLQLAKLEQEQTNMKRQELLNGRILSLSKMIVIRGSELKDKLVQISNDLHNSELDQVRKELEYLIRSADSGHPEIADSVIQES